VSPIVTQHARPYPETERHDELSAGVPQDRASRRRKPGTGIQKGDRKIPALGGQAHKGTTRTSHRIDSETLPQVYRDRARTFRRLTCSELARTVGGGVCGIIPSLLVKHAAVATALAEMALDAGDTDKAVKYAESSRSHLLFARELCAKDAAARPRVPVDPLAAYRGLPDPEAP
jgi:hypothetical protein